MLLVNATALHVAVFLDIEEVASELLPKAGEAMHFSSGPRSLRWTPFRLACSLGRKAIAT